MQHMFLCVGISNLFGCDTSQARTQKKHMFLLQASVYAQAPKCNFQDDAINHARFLNKNFSLACARLNDRYSQTLRGVKNKTELRVL